MMRTFTILSCLIASVSLNAFAASSGPVKVVGQQLLVDFDKDGIYEPFLIKSVGYSPYPIGRHASDWGWPAGDPRPSNIYDDPAILERDFQLLQNMHANAIRIWKGNNTTQVDGRFPNKITTRTLDYAQKHNLKVLAGFWMEDVDYTVTATRNDFLQRFSTYVSSFKDHPAILCWVIGNENNYRFNPNTTANAKAYFTLVNAMAQKAHDIEGANYHPVAVVNGEIANIGNSTFNTTDSQMPALDIWGANIYRGSSFGTLFKDYAAKSKKPLWISEYGLDAWFTRDIKNPSNGYDDQLTQSQWLTKLWQEIQNNSTASVGGSIMEYSDEWWKPYEFRCGANSDLCNRTHDFYGDLFTASDDHVVNEEWLGLMAISPGGIQAPDIMTPRLAYSALQELWALHLAPVINPISKVIILSGYPSKLTVTASDPQNKLQSLDVRLANGDALTTLGASLSVDLSKGQASITWTPKDYQRGTYSFVVIAINAYGQQTTMSFIMQVNRLIPSHPNPVRVTPTTPTR